MRAWACWLAVGLAVVLPWQAVAQGVRLQQREVVAQETAQQAMERISKSRNMQVWDRLTAEEYREIPAGRRVRDRNFSRQAVPLRRIVGIPREDVQSIELKVINGLHRYEIAVSRPEEVSAGIRPGKASAMISEEYYDRATDYAYYSIEPQEFDRVLDIIENMQVKVYPRDTDRGYDYRMAISIKYKDGHTVYLASDGLYWAHNHTRGSIIGLGREPIHVDYSFRDLNILFQYIDPNMIIFSTRYGSTAFFDQWEAERHLPQ
ncbi:MULTISPECIES: hypothetical protein [Eikenella]|uniref:Uncharacterized protein n=1 Tax=Eikenella longinqua TaxID=1795827 RepID=A0A1A9RX25_9NEIS|nr:MULTISPECIES: hypothetical protein [Eikenella]OAM27722.1 hypothetical protein A7P95_06290 [Eikenella longinqua]